MTRRAPAPASESDTGAPPRETDVLIVGGGPVGSALAIDLRLRGIRCAIVERIQGIAYDMRAMNNDMRTMEHFRGWGIADVHRACSPLPPSFQQDLVFCSALYGQELGVFRAYGFRAEDAEPLAAEPGQPLSQKFTNVVLRRRAEELGTPVATGWEFTELTQTARGVTADIAPVDGGPATRVRAQAA